MGRRTLYQRLLGKDFDRLPPILQRFHSLPQGGRAAGFVTVSREDGWLPDVAARTLGLPSPGEDIPLWLEVGPRRDSELWIRQFGGRYVTTLQWQEGEFLIE